MHKSRLRCALVLPVYVTMLAQAGCGGGSTSASSSPPPSGQHTIGGDVAGLGANDSVTLLNNGGDSLVVSGNIGFTFSTPQEVGSTYAVTLQSHTPGIACSVGNGNGSVVSSDVASVSVSCAAGSETILYSFGSGPIDGANPQAALIMDSAGNLYGTTYGGGAMGVGTVFKISAAGAESVLHSFAGGPTDGANPQAGVIIDSAGNLYGTTTLGGANGLGTVFKVSAAGTESVLYSFAGSPTDGGYPKAGVIIDSVGNLYGTTSTGGSMQDSGTLSNGIVFKVSATGAESVLYSFAGGTIDGRVPDAGLIMDSAGNLYGTTSAGGSVQDFGTVFKISAAGMESILHSFAFVALLGAATDGDAPTAGLIMDSAGNLYGTTTYGGKDKQGTVFMISATGTESILYFFTGGKIDGAQPQAGLVIDSAGSLYGTTVVGGANGEGMVFKISTGGTESVLHFFAGAPTDGNEPVAGLIMDSAGNLYGTTAVGGANDEGTVFKIN
jgi:uncharacterized repeat protein (TIGR03803 family)